ncbi:Thymidylate synthase [compost metagenome]
MSLNEVDRIQHNLYQTLMESGYLKGDRTGVGTLMLPGLVMDYDISDKKIPLPSTKEVFNKSWGWENLMFISGSSNLKLLKDNNVSIWDNWFIPGTAVYDEPKRVAYSLDERIQVAVDAGHRDIIIQYIQEYEKANTSIGSYVIVVQDANGDLLEFFNRPKSSLDALWTYLDNLAIPEYNEAGGGKPVGIQTRLKRVAKNMTLCWHEINKIVFNFGDEVAPGDKPYKVVVFHKGKFVDVEISSTKVAAINKIMDNFDIPKYPLLEADIGQGSYGVQWRRWQDTQIVDPKDVDAYREQGYTYRGEFFDHSLAVDKCVMHRDIDQLQNCIDMLRKNPDDRRMIVNAWNPGRTWQAALPPCHLYFQFISYPKKAGQILDDLEKAGMLNSLRQAISEDYGTHVIETVQSFEKKYEEDEEFYGYVKRFCEHAVVGVNPRMLSTLMVMRSNDYALGMPFNVAQYAALTHMVAHVTGHDTDRLIIVGGDCHLYVNQLEGIAKQLERTSTEDSDPRFIIKRKIAEIDDFTFEDFHIVDYKPQPNIPMPVAV